LRGWPRTPSPAQARNDTDALCARGEELAANRLRGGASVRLAVGASLNSTSINSPSAASRPASPPGPGVRAAIRHNGPEGEELLYPDSAPDPPGAWSSGWRDAAAIRLVGVLRDPSDFSFRVRLGKVGREAELLMLRHEVVPPRRTAKRPPLGPVDNSPPSRASGTRLRSARRSPRGAASKRSPNPSSSGAPISTGPATTT
jgi:hypothetical protein